MRGVVGGHEVRELWRTRDEGSCGRTRGEGSSGRE